MWAVPKIRVPFGTPRHYRCHNVFYNQGGHLMLRTAQLNGVKEEVREGTYIFT